MSDNDTMREALERIRDIAKSWEGRKEAPYWNLGDIAAAALKKISKICRADHDYMYSINVDICPECKKSTHPDN